MAWVAQLPAMASNFMDVSQPQSTQDPLRVDQFLRLMFWASAAGRNLRRCLNVVARSAELTDGELLAVWLCLGEAGGMVQGELAAALGISPAQMSGIVERLRQRGLIEMHRQALDRRRQVWRGTTAARQLLDSLAAALTALSGGLSTHLPPDQQHTAQALCQQLATAAQEWPEESIDASLGSGTDRPHDGSTRKAA
jgi:DNA-binding MarR family transcriptional regulator